MKIRKLVSGDSAKMSAIHLNSFKGFFLTSLGYKFLKSFYAVVLSDEQGAGVGIEANGEMIGFAIGTTQEKGFYKRILKSHAPVLLKNAFIPLITHPSRIRHLLNSLRGGARSYVHYSGSLLSICIDPGQQANGVGRKLIKAFEEQLAKKGCDSVSLTTDHEDNENVNQFYLRNDYKLVETFQTSNQRLMNLYLKKLHK